MGMRLHDFYDMTWYEFCLKKFAYFRERNHMEKETWYNTRFLAHRIAISQHSKPHPSWFTENGLEKFLPIDSERTRVRITQANRENHLREYEEYLRQKNSKK